MTVNSTLAKRSKGHQSYYLEDGAKAPSVTTILGVISKPALYRWHNKMGLQGIDTSVYVQAAADAGTCAHDMIEAHLNGVEFDSGMYPPDLVKLAENGYIKWLEWEKGFGTFRLIYSEKAFVSEKYRFGGKIDSFVEAAGKNLLVDIKTSDSGIWPEMRCQVAAYEQLLIENGERVDGVMIVRVGKTSAMDFQVESIDRRDKHFELFLHAKAIYDLQGELK